MQDNSLIMHIHSYHIVHFRSHSFHSTHYKHVHTMILPVSSSPFSLQIFLSLQIIIHYDYHCHNHILTLSKFSSFLNHLCATNLQILFSADTFPAMWVKGTITGVKYIFTKFLHITKGGPQFSTIIIKKKKEKGWIFQFHFTNKDKLGSFGHINLFLLSFL